MCSVELGLKEMDYDKLGSKGYLVKTEKV
jgi:hypothetical protein